MWTDIKWLTDFLPTFVTLILKKKERKKVIMAQITPVIVSCAPLRYVVWCNEINVGPWCNNSFMDENRLVLIPDMFLQLLNPEFHSCVQTFLFFVFLFSFLLGFFGFFLFCFLLVFVVVVVVCFNFSFWIVDTGQILLTMLGYLWRPIS